MHVVCLTRFFGWVWYFRVKLRDVTINVFSAVHHAQTHFPIALACKESTSQMREKVKTKSESPAPHTGGPLAVSSTDGPAYVAGPDTNFGRATYTRSRSEKAAL